MSRTTKQIVDQEVYVCQTSLVEELLSHELIYYDDIINLYDDDDEPQEVFQWFAVSDWLAVQLEEMGYPIIRHDLGTWYGRTCFGQALYMDYNMKVIGGEIEVENDDEFTDNQLRMMGIAI